MVVCVLIEAEENSEIPGVGIEKLMESGKLDFIKNGPVIWVDCSDCQPCIRTAGVISWTLKATGKLFHNGLPHLGIKSIELGMDALCKIQERFYTDFGPVEKEKEYNYSYPSTPPWVKSFGEVRLSSFYDMEDLQAKVQSYVADLNANITSLEGKHEPVSKYTLPEENKSGNLELTFEKHYLEGIACSLYSLGYKCVNIHETSGALHAAITEVLGNTQPFYISGSLPLVRYLQRAGLDLTLTGFGKSSVYHGNNEYCQLSDMANAIKILARTIAYVDASSHPPSRDRSLPNCPLSVFHISNHDYTLLINTFKKRVRVEIAIVCVEIEKACVEIAAPIWKYYTLRGTTRRPSKRVWMLFSKKQGYACYSAKNEGMHKIFPDYN
ncbi:hypothetical protein PsorP6_016806 [Peronosclerospora sorghi]|uniref:Uncharacterized protein n=1 Tax=Peronosclerospora sorghi TaxID=230839 RepID=A0ACC0WDW0_9STRA|nr:hypothetical protein PsorP6_016806 [Peronosclerospora sorghi]